MCDKTHKGLIPYAGLTRRSFAVLGTVAAAGLAGSANAQTPSVIESDVSVRTADGVADSVLFHPEGKRRWPGVLLWPDAGGLRAAMRDMGRRLAGQGYVVLVVNPYYRSGVAAATAASGTGQDPAQRERRTAMRALMTDDAIARDAGTFVARLDALPQTSRAKVGVQGYCMGGPLSFRTAAAVPGRVGAVGSFHGGGLVTENPNSPHLLIEKTKARYLVAVARNDDASDPKAKEVLRETFGKLRRPATVEVYGGNHGWCVPDNAQYQQAEAERAWAALTAMYKTALV